MIKYRDRKVRRNDSGLKTINNYSFFLFPLILKRKLRHLLFLCENDLECSLEQKKAICGLTSAFLQPVRPHYVYFGT